MKKLLTVNEMYENCENRYTEDGTAFYTVGEPRGVMKQFRIDKIDETTFTMIEQGFKLLGLEDYIEMYNFDEGAFFRIHEEE